MGNNKYKILIVEDEANIRSFIKANLETSDYQVICAETCTLGIMLYASHHPDLIILDLGLPDRDGLDLIQKVRESDTVPIIVLSARSNERDKVEALDYGADDYLVKPFALEELSARLRVLTRSQFGVGDSRLVAGDLTLDTGTRRVKRGDAEIALSAREYALLEYLMHNKGIVLSREKIENHVWNFDYEGGTNVVDVYIRYLRKKIDDGHERKLIHTVRGMGYVLREETP